MLFKAEQVTCHANCCATNYFNVWLNLSQTFQGNDNNYQVKKNTLQPGVVAILIRLRPTDWYHKPCMRLEVYGEPDLHRGNCYCFIGIVFVGKCYPIRKLLERA